jgi:lysophospholipase
MQPSSGVRFALPILLLILLGVAACGGPDVRAPFTDSRIPPGLDHRFYPPQGWAWGLLQVGSAPPVRYGVSAPAGATQAQVLILTSYGEPAEAWFETVRDLNARGYVVWVMEPAGQGGSGRYGGRRDLGDAPSLDPDVAALLLFPNRIAANTPLFVLASGASAPVAMRAAGMGLKAQGLILSAPRFDAGSTGDLEKAARMRRFGLGWLRADAGEVWRRDGKDDLGLGFTHDPARGRLRQAWQIANPDLRMGGPSWRWRAAFADQVTGARLARPGVHLPTLVLAAPWDGVSPCSGIANCSCLPIPGAGRDPQLETDDLRSAWLVAVLGFIEPSGAALAPERPAVTVDSGG